MRLFTFKTRLRPYISFYFGTFTGGSSKGGSTEVAPKININK